MRVIFAVAVLLISCGRAAAAAPQRIMSLKVCTDGLLMDLVPVSRIASVTFLSRSPQALRWWPQAAKIPVNHASAEEILAARPDLILTDTVLSPLLLRLLAQTNAKVVMIPPAENFTQIRSAIRIAAAALGEKARGERLIAGMNADLDYLAAHRPAHSLTVAGWGGGGYVPGGSGLFDAMLTAAGARNIEHGAFGYYDVETLIAKNPDLLAYGDTYAGTASLRDDQNQHPALMARYTKRRIAYPALYGCGLPETAKVARQFQAALLGAPR